MSNNKTAFQAQKGIDGVAIYVSGQTYPIGAIREKDLVLYKSKQITSTSFIPAEWDVVGAAGGTDLFWEVSDITSLNSGNTPTINLTGNTGLQQISFLTDSYIRLTSFENKSAQSQNYSRSTFADSAIILSVNNAGSEKSINILDYSNGITVNDADDQIGLVYVGDYTTNGPSIGGAFWIPPKGYNDATYAPITGLTIDIESGFNSAVYAQNIGVSSDVPLISFQHDTGRTLTDYYSDVYIGPSNGNPTGDTGGNIGIGQGNLRNITPSGSFFGTGTSWYSTFIGDRNIAIGFDVMANMTGDAGNQGSGNVGIGERVMNLTQNDSYNVAIGFHAMRNYNVPVTVWGYEGSSNIAMGDYAMENITSGSSNYNIAIGSGVLQYADNVNQGNVIMGSGTLQNASLGVDTGNVVIGNQTLRYAPEIHGTNVIIGPAIGLNITGATHVEEDNTLIGNSVYRDGDLSTNNGHNTAIGAGAAWYGGGRENTTYGAQSAWLVRGEYNLSLGNQAGFASDQTIQYFETYANPPGTPLTGGHNVFIGYRSGWDATSSGVSDTFVMGKNYRPVLTDGEFRIGSQNKLTIETDITGTSSSFIFTGGTGIIASVDDGIYFGDENLGFESSASGDLVIRMSSSSWWNIDANGTGDIWAQNSNGLRLNYGAASNTVPSFMPNRNDEATGLGGVLGEVALITSGITALSVDSGQTVTIYSGLTLSTTPSSGSSDQILIRDSGTGEVKYTSLGALGGGDVTKVGTPVDNQVGVWTGDGTIEGTTGLTYNGTLLRVNDDITTSNITADTITINGPSFTDAVIKSPTQGSFAAGYRAGEASGTVGTDFVAIGRDAGQGGGTIKIGNSAVGIGHGTDIQGLNSVAIGYFAWADSGYTISIGSQTGADALNGIAIGELAWVTGEGGIAMGKSSEASAQGAMMFGFHSATQENTVTDTAEFSWDGIRGLKFGPLFGTQITNNANPDANLTAAEAGSLAWDTTDKEVRVYDGTGWTTVGSSGDYWKTSGVTTLSGDTTILSNLNNIIFDQDETGTQAANDPGLGKDNFIVGSNNVFPSTGDTDIYHNIIFGEDNTLTTVNNLFVNNFIHALGVNMTNVNNFYFNWIQGSSHTINATAGLTQYNFIGGRLNEVVGTAYNSLAFGYQVRMGSNGSGFGMGIATGAEFLDVGRNSHNFSGTRTTTNTDQTVGHGAFGLHSAMLGGVNHNIPDNANTDFVVIVGGEAIKASTATGSTHTVYMPKVRIGQGFGAGLTQDDTATQVAVIDDTTGEIKWRDVTTIGGGSGSTTLNALTDTNVSGATVGSLLYYDTGSTSWLDSNTGMTYTNGTTRGLSIERVTGGDIVMNLENNGGGTSSETILSLQTAGGAGDPQLRIRVGSGTRSFALGIDNSDSDKLKITTSGGVATPSSAGVIMTMDGTTSGTTFSGTITTATDTAGGYLFGDGDSGFYEISDDIINVRRLGSSIFQWNASGYIAFVSGGPAMLNEASSLSNPTFNPQRGDPDSGLGGDGNNSIALITSGATALSIDPSGNTSIERGHLEVATGNTNGGIWFNNVGSTYISNDGTNQIFVGISNVNRWRFGQSDLTYVASADGPRLRAGGGISDVHFGFRDDSNTGMYRVNPDELALVTSGASALNIDPSGNTRIERGDLIVDSNATGDFGVYFGDGDTGFFEIVDDQLFLKIANINRWAFLGNIMGSQNGDGGGLSNLNSSASQPTLLPQRNDDTTGMGGADNELDLITTGTSALNVDSDRFIHIQQGLTVNGALPLATTTTPFYVALATGEDARLGTVSVEQGASSTGIIRNENASGVLYIYGDNLTGAAQLRLHARNNTTTGGFYLYGGQFNDEGADLSSYIIGARPALSLTANTEGGHIYIDGGIKATGGTNDGNVYIATNRGELIAGTATVTGNTYLTGTTFISLPTSGSSDQALIRNTTTGAIEYKNLSTLGGGDVTKSGTAVDNQIAVWVSDGSIEGDSNFIWDGFDLTITGDTNIHDGALRLNGTGAGTSGIDFINTGTTYATFYFNDNTNYQVLRTITDVGFRIQTSGATDSLLVEPNGDVNISRGNLTFGDGDTYIGETVSDDRLDFYVAGALKFFFISNSIRAGASTGPELITKGASATSATIIPNRGSDTTGIGGAAGEIDLIITGASALNVDNDKFVSIPTRLQVGGSINSTPGLMNVGDSVDGDVVQYLINANAGTSARTIFEVKNSTGAGAQLRLTVHSNNHTTYPNRAIISASSALSGGLDIGTTNQPIRLTLANTARLTMENTGDITISQSLEINNDLILSGTTTGATDSNQILTRNSSTGVVEYRDASTITRNDTYNVTGITGNTTLTDNEFVVLVDTSGSAITVTLPSSPTTNKVYKIKDKGNALTNNITISGNGNNIDGSANATINTDYGAFELLFDGTEWFSLAFVN